MKAYKEMWLLPAVRSPGRQYAIVLRARTENPGTDYSRAYRDPSPASVRRIMALPGAVHLPFARDREILFVRRDVE